VLCTNRAVKIIINLGGHNGDSESNSDKEEVDFQEGCEAYLLGV
jgi:hypothetical protein